MNFEIIKSAIDKWDPIDLLTHAPKDEYDVECLQISKVYTESIEELGKSIYIIFLTSFGSAFSKNEEDCIVIAKAIIDIST